MASTFISIAEVDKSRGNRAGVKLSDGSWMSCFDKALWPRLEAGANLNVDVAESQRNGTTYRNIIAILGAAASPNGTASSSQKETNIIRESALRAACDLFAGEIGQDDTAVDFILHTADRFVHWIEQAEEEALF